MHEDREGIKLTAIEFPALIQNRRREMLQISSPDELLNHVDCDGRFNTVQNILAARTQDQSIIDPWSLLTEETKHMLNLYARQRRFGMCYLFKDWSECPLGVQVSFDTIAQVIETNERKLLENHGNRASRTDNQNKVRHSKSRA